jgi:hypothetical protein
MSRVPTENEGKMKWRTGPMILEVFSDESISVDIENIKHIQIMTGSQYLTNFCWINVVAPPSQGDHLDYSCSGIK